MQPFLGLAQSRSRVLHLNETSRKIKQADKAFSKNPYEAGKSVLDPKCEVRLKCEKSSLDNFKIQSFSDAFGDVPLPPLKCFPWLLLFLKNLIVPVFKQKTASISYSRRNGSSSGISMIPYQVYKNIPQMVPFLFQIFQSILKQATVPIHWRVCLSFIFQR